MAEAFYYSARFYRKKSHWVRHFFFFILFITTFFFANLLAFQQLERPVTSLPRKRSLLQPPPSQTLEVKPMVSVIVDDAGENYELLMQLSGFSLPLTISIIPGLKYSRETAAWATQHGHEVMVHLPMEPEAYPFYDPGKNALMTWMSPDQIALQTTALLQTIPEAVGVNNHMGSRFSKNGRTMAPVLDVIAAKKMYFIDSRTSPFSLAYELALAKNIPAGRRTLFLDDPLDPQPFGKRWEELIRMAKIQGSAIGICHLRPETVQMLCSISQKNREDVLFTFASRAVQSSLKTQHGTNPAGTH